MSPDSKPPWLPPPAPKMIRRRENGKQADAPCFQESSPCFLSVMCPFVLNRLPVFLGKYPCFWRKIRAVLPGEFCAAWSCGRPHADLPGNAGQGRRRGESERHRREGRAMDDRARAPCPVRPGRYEGGRAQSDEVLRGRGT